MLLDLSIAPSKFWPSRSDFAYQHMNATPINTMKSMTYPKWQSHMQALICQALSGYRSILLTHSYYSLHSNTRIGCLGVQWVSIKCMTFPVQRGSSWAMVVMLSMFVSLFEQCEANTMNKPQRSAGRGWTIHVAAVGGNISKNLHQCLFCDIDSSLVTQKRTQICTYCNHGWGLYMWRWKTIWTIGQNTVDKESLATVFL